MSRKTRERQREGQSKERVERGRTSAPSSCVILTEGDREGGNQ